MTESLAFFGTLTIFAGLAFLSVSIILAALIRRRPKPTRHLPRMVPVPFDELPEPIRMLAQDLAESGANIIVCLVESDPFSQAPVDRKIASEN